MGYACFTSYSLSQKSPRNTGNIIRLCANVGCSLHLIEPLGFAFDDKRLRRAGLDYQEFANVQLHANLQDCLTALQQPRLFAFSTKGKHNYAEVVYQDGDAFILVQKREACLRMCVTAFLPSNWCAYPCVTARAA